MLYEFSADDLTNAQAVCDAALRAGGLNALGPVNRLLAKLSKPVEQEPAQEAEA